MLRGAVGEGPLADGEPWSSRVEVSPGRDKVLGKE